jgi:hypothetical protein
MNEWTQYTIGKWAESANFVYHSSYNVSAYENGKNLHPRPTTFMLYAELNLKLVTITNEDLIKIKDQSIRKIIKKSKPLQGDCVWRVEHFFLHFIGEIPRPTMLEAFMEPSPSLLFGSKEEAFMSLSSKRFTLSENFILTPDKMTNSEQAAVHFLCTKHNYRSTLVKLNGFN